MNRINILSSKTLYTLFIQCVFVQQVYKFCMRVSQRALHTKATGSAGLIDYRLQWVCYAQQIQLCISPRSKGLK